MAEAAQPSGAIEQAIQRYGAIEQAYRDQLWPTVLQEGNLLLGDLGTGRDPISEGLRQRLLLLLGHTQLHGFRDPEAARDFYGAVLKGDAEASLLRIAEEGLQQCEVAAAPDVPEQPSVPEQPAFGVEPAEAATVPPAAPEQTPAMPWLESSGVIPLVPEVVEEPELIELHQADPALAEEVDLKVRPAPAEQAAGDREDQDLRQGLLRVVLS